MKDKPSNPAINTKYKRADMTRFLNARHDLEIDGLLGAALQRGNRCPGLSDGMRREFSR